MGSEPSVPEPGSDDSCDSRLYGRVHLTVSEADGTQATLDLTWGQVAYLHSRLGQLRLALIHGFPFDWVHRYGSVYGIDILHGRDDAEVQIICGHCLVTIPLDQVLDLRTQLEQAIQALPLE